MKKTVRLCFKIASLAIASFNALFYFAMRPCWSGISKFLGYEKGYNPFILNLPVIVMGVFALVFVVALVDFFFISKKTGIASYIITGFDVVLFVALMVIVKEGALDYMLYIWRNFWNSMIYVAILFVAIFFIFFYHKTFLKDCKIFKLGLIALLSCGGLLSLLKVSITMITYEPVVYAVEDEYQIVFSSSNNAFGSVKIGDKEYYDLFSGSEKSFSKVHKVCVPMSELNEKKEYTISIQHPLYRGPFGGILGKEITKKYNFVPADKTDGINYFTLSDVHMNLDQAAKTARYDENMDFLLILGDIASYLQTEEDAQMANKLAFDITKGEKPVVYARGNHETKGEYAEQLYKYVGSKDEKFYYSFRLDGVYGLVLDIGEDHDDDWWEYYGTSHFDEYRNEQKEFLANEIAKNDFASYDYRLVLCHIPPVFVNSRKNHQEIKKDITEALNQMNIDMVVTGHQHELYVFEPGAVTLNTKLTYNPAFKNGTYNGYLTDFNFPVLMVSKTGFTQKDSGELNGVQSFIGLKVEANITGRSQTCTYINSKNEKVSVVNPFANIDYGNEIVINLDTKEMK